MLYPKLTKYKKMHKGNLRGKNALNINMPIGNIGLISLESCWLYSKQIEAALKVINRHIKKYGKCILKVFPDQSRTARPSESRMGSGKGEIKHWVAKIKKNTLIFELINVPLSIADAAFKECSYKMPVKTQIKLNR